MKFTELSDSQKEILISSGIRFVADLTEMLGLEQGKNLFDQLTSDVDPDFTGSLMFALLTGNTGGKVRLLRIDAVTNYGMTHGYGSNAVPIIKCIRTHTGYGLKEAKDAYDAVKNGGVSEFQVDRQYHAAFVRDLIALGCDAR